MQLNHVESVSPDYEVFPDFDDLLKSSMYEESLRVLDTLIEEDRSLLELIDADFTWLNSRLASHYGLSDLLSLNLPDQFERVALPQGGRLGFMTQAAWLTVTSQATRTSPVLRGKWVLENLLCMPPPPPPPSVEGLIESVNQNASVRERLEQHRADPACAACHTHMDSIGFGFEQFDGVGAFRTTDAQEVIDPSGELPSDPAISFSDAVEMVQNLRHHENVGRCFTERLVIYALGRGLSEDERCMVDEITLNAAEGDFTLNELAHAITQSPLFLTRGLSRDDDVTQEETQEGNTP